jgi:chromosome segregation ATPase
MFVCLTRTSFRLKRTASFLYAFATDPGTGYALNTVATSGVPAPSHQNAPLTAISGVAPQQSPSKPVSLWAAWRETPASSLTATEIVAVVTSGIANIPARVSCADLALPLPAPPQPAPVPLSATARTGEGRAAEGSLAAPVRMDHGERQEAEAWAGKVAAHVDERVRVLDTVVTRPENSCSSNHAPSYVLQPLVAADAEVLVQLRQALGQISELMISQRAAQAREMELQRDTAALRAQLHNGQATLQAREAALQQAEAHIAELRNAQQAWQQREAQFLGVSSALAHSEESRRSMKNSMNVLEAKLAQEKGAFMRLQRHYQQNLAELQAVKKTAGEPDSDGANEARAALPAKDACTSVSQTELQQATRRISELERAEHTIKARETHLTQENVELRQRAEQTRVVLQTANHEVARLQSQSAHAAWDAALATVAVGAQTTPVTQTQLQRVRELEDQVQQLKHALELLRNDRDVQLQGAENSMMAHEEQLQKLYQEAEARRDELRTREKAIVTLTTDQVRANEERGVAARQATELKETHALLCTAQTEISSLKGKLQDEQQRLADARKARIESERRLNKQIADLFRIKRI